MAKNKGAVINHKAIGEIHVKWDEERLLVTGINLREPFEGIEYEDEHFIKIRFPELYQYLVEFGNGLFHNFPIECLDFSWASHFYRKVYRKLYGVKPGSVVTYSKLACLVGNPKASRAVGTAMNKNRFPIAIACHRVVGKNSLGNFACGMDMKIILLRLEGFDNLPE